LIALEGCTTSGTPVTPQILALNYVVKTVPDASTLIASVRDGQTTISTMLARDPCNFTADFSERTPPTKPKFSVYGTPGQTGFNVRILSTTPVAIPTTNPSSCQALDEIEVLIGGQSEALALRTQTSRTSGRVWLVNGQKFETGAFFKAQVLSFDPANRRTTGEFQFINRLSAGSNTVLIVEGSYAMKP
jgi:hypothetical protein